MSIVKVNYLRLLCCKESNARFYDRRKSNEFILRWIQNMSSSYFNFQIKGLLEEKNITINQAFAFISPAWLAHHKYSSSLHQQNLIFDFVYNITSSVWRNGLSVLKTTAFLAYPPHFPKFNCNPAPLTLETVNFEQSNVLCESMQFYGQTESAVKYFHILQPTPFDRSLTACM